MPTFPPCPPNIPQVLNPLDPRHSWLLFKWVFFQPSKLKHYLYRVDPEIYQAKHIWHTRKLPAYRGLYLTSLLLTCLMSLLVVGAGFFLVGSTFDWHRVLYGVVLSVIVSIGLGGMLGVTLGTALGVVFGVVLEISLGTGLSVVLSIQSDPILVLAIGMAVGCAVSMSWAVVWGVPVGAAAGFAVGSAAGMATSLSVAVVWTTVLHTQMMASGMILA